MPARPSIPRLMLVTDSSRARLPLLDLAAEAVAGGVDAIYLRAAPTPLPPSPSALGEGGWLPTPEVIHELRARVGDRVALLVNDAELAMATGAGLHLRERDPLLNASRLGAFRADARGRVPTAAAISERQDSSVRFLGMTTPVECQLIGRSVHSPLEAAASTGMDYILAGHVYPSASKPGLPPIGLEGLRAIVAAAPCPVLAIGGITPERVAKVVHSGAHGMAVIGAIAEADDPRAAASALRAALDRARQQHQEESAMPETASVLNGTATIELTVNGKPVSVTSGATVHDFLASKKMTDAMAIVERNGEIVPRDAYGTTVLTPRDRLEVVHAVGGG